MKALAALALLSVAEPLAAQAAQCRVPAKLTVPMVRPDGPARRMAVTGYTLALSWSPEFCRSRDRPSDGAQCSGRDGRFGLVVHGLWPEGAGGWPQWCAPPRLLSAREARRNFCMMPSARLQATEWAKHGACMVRTPESYFKVTRILYGSLRMPDLVQLSREPGLNVGELRRRFVASNDGWRAEAVGVKLNRRGWLEEVRLCYDKRFRPTRCNDSQLGASDRTWLKIWRGPSAVP